MVAVGTERADHGYACLAKALREASLTCVAMTGRQGWVTKARQP